MSLRVIAVILLSLLLSASSFSLIDTLNKMLASGEYQKEPKRYHSQYMLSLNLGLPAAQYQHLKDLDYGSFKWRLLAEKLARSDADIAWQLAQYYADKQHQRNYQYWFTKSLELGSVDALIANIKRNLKEHSSQDDYLSAKASLALLINSNEDALILSTHLAIEYNDQHQLNLNLKQLNTEKGLHLLSLINHYKIYNNSHANNGSNQISAVDLHNQKYAQVKPAICQNKMQFFATSIQALTRLEKLINSIAKDSFYGKKFCFSTPRFISRSELNCTNSNSQRIQCDESIWQTKTIESDVKYLGILVDSGGANVNHGILYIDQQDNKQVLEHELMHLVGFIDEYPLTVTHDACANPKNTAIANNILLSHQQYFDDEHHAREALLDQIPWRDLIVADTPLTSPVKVNNTIMYKLGTPRTHKNRVGLFPADTCSRHNVLSFKPLHATTKLEFFEEKLPKEYQELSIISADNYNMPSYQYNIGLSLNKQANRALASKWFIQSAKFEKNEERQKVISRGGF